MKTYGWPWPEPAGTILDRLVALHDRRVEEEGAGTVRWLRPDYQIPRFGKPAAEAGTASKEGETTQATPVIRVPWPHDAIGQIGALRALAASRAVTVDEATEHFDGARRDLVLRHLETLAIIGELQLGEEGRYSATLPLG